MRPFVKLVPGIGVKYDALWRIKNTSILHVISPELHGVKFTLFQSVNKNNKDQILSDGN